MIRRTAAAVAVALLTISLTPGTAHSTGRAQLIPPLTCAVSATPHPLTCGYPLSSPRLSRRASPTSSRDWTRSPLIVAAVTAKKPPQPSVPSASASPTLGTTRGGAAVGNAAAPSSAANALPRTAVEPAGTTSVQGTAQAYARTLVTAAQWPCLRPLWQHESGWSSTAANRRSTAFGIAQRLDETSTSWRTQIDNGIAYIKTRYGSACAAWAFWTRNRWY